MPTDFVQIDDSSDSAGPSESPLSGESNAPDSDVLPSIRDLKLPNFSTLFEVAAPSNRPASILPSDLLDLQLKTVIEHTNSIRLRMVMLEMCAAVPGAREFIKQRLTYDVAGNSNDKGETSDEGSDDESEDEGEEGHARDGHGEQVGPNRKRKRESFDLRFPTCIQCHQEYDASQNDVDSCIWHSGKSCSGNTKGSCLTGHRQEGN
jgi:hypothetical protein